MNKILLFCQKLPYPSSVNYLNIFNLLDAFNIANDLSLFSFVCFFYLVQKSPQHRQIVSSILLLHIVREAEQRHLLSAAPQWRTVDQRSLWERSQEETRVSKQEFHDRVGRYAGVSPDECVDFLEHSVQILEWEDAKFKSLTRDSIFCIHQTKKNYKWTAVCFVSP